MSWQVDRVDHRDEDVKTDEFKSIVSRIECCDDGDVQVGEGGRKDATVGPSAAEMDEAPRNASPSSPS